MASGAHKTRLRAAPRISAQRTAPPRRDCARDRRVWRVRRASKLVRHCLCRNPGRNREKGDPPGGGGRMADRAAMSPIPPKHANRSSGLPGVCLRRAGAVRTGAPQSSREAPGRLGLRQLQPGRAGSRRFPAGRWPTAGWGAKPPTPSRIKAHAHARIRTRVRAFPPSPGATGCVPTLGSTVHNRQQSITVTPKTVCPGHALALSSGGCSTDRSPAPCCWPAIPSKGASHLVVIFRATR